MQERRSAVAEVREGESGGQKGELLRCGRDQGDGGTGRSEEERYGDQGEGQGRGDQHATREGGCKSEVSGVGREGQRTASASYKQAKQLAFLQAGSKGRRKRGSGGRGVQHDLLSGSLRHSHWSKKESTVHSIG